MGQEEIGPRAQRPGTWRKNAQHRGGSGQLLSSKKTAGFGSREAAGDADKSSRLREREHFAMLSLIPAFTVQCYCYNWECRPFTHQCRIDGSGHAFVLR